MNIILENLSSCSKTKGKNSKRLKKSLNMILTMRGNLGSNSKTNLSNLRISSAAKKLSSLSLSSKWTTFFIRIRISLSKMKDSRTSWPDWRISMAVRFINWKHNLAYKLAIMRTWPTSTTLSSKSSRRKDRITSSRSLSTLKGKLKVLRKESEMQKMQKEYFF